MGFCHCLREGRRYRKYILPSAASLNPLVWLLIHSPAISSYCQLDKQLEPAPELLKSHVYRNTMCLRSCRFQSRSGSFFSSQRREARVLPSMIFPDKAILTTCFTGKKRTVIRSSSSGRAFPRDRPRARNTCISSSRKPGLG